MVGSVPRFSMSLAAGKGTRKDSNQGRLVVDDQGRMLGVVEAVDIRQRSVFSKPRNISEQSLTLRHHRLLRIIQDGFAEKGQIPENSKFGTGSVG